MKNKIFFWTNYYIEHPEVGTTAKIRSEVQTLRSMGYEVTYTAYLDNGVAVYDNSDIQVSYKKFISQNSLFLKAFRRSYLTSISRRFLRDHTFDFCILRINSINNSYYNMLKEMKKQGAFVMMESLSYYPNMDFGNIKKASYFMIARSLKKHEKDLKNVVDMMLTEGVLDDFYGIPCVEFGMGVDVDNYKKHNYTGSKRDLHLLMVGCDSVYHGTDRIINSVCQYYQKPISDRKVYLHLVGDILSKDQTLIKKVNLGDKIICYGRRYGKELDAIFDTCNIALGPLAQHRIQKKDTGLKTKEYFARGIPYLYTGQEVRIEDDYPYICQLNDDESIIDLYDIFSFYDKICNDKTLEGNMRNKARQVFSWNNIFERTFEVARKIQQNR